MFWFTVVMTPPLVGFIGEKNKLFKGWKKNGHFHRGNSGCTLPVLCIFVKCTGLSGEKTGLGVATVI